MHEVGEKAIISTRLELPTKDKMSKLETTIVSSSGNDPAMEPYTQVQTTTEKVAASDSSVNMKDSMEAPHPVTPETPKVQDGQGNSTPPPATGDENSPTIKKNLQNLSMGEILPNRGRVLSLDRGSEESKSNDGYQSPDTTPHTDDERFRRNPHERYSQSKRSTKKQYDDGSSSDDDSYFAKHLPSPKSGRSYSYSSAGSAPVRRTSSGSFYQGSVARESDASLSFSDESDDDMPNHPGVHVSPMIPPKGTVADMHLYPQRITRMHSVSSLVSSASSEDERPPHPQAPRRMSSSSMSSHTTVGTNSDTKIRAELQDMAIVGAEGRSQSQMSDASGRRSPVMGQHANGGYFFSSPSPGRMKQSPPPIMQGYVPPQGVPHPQPQIMTNDQMSAWVSAGSTSPTYLGVPSQQGYGSTTQSANQMLPGMSPHTGGFKTVSETNYGVPTHHYANGASAPDSQQQMNAPSGGVDRSQQQGQLPADNGTNDSQNVRSRSSGTSKAAVAASGGGGSGKISPQENDGSKGFQVYWQRWVMLFYMSALNLLSDWTCYSVAPIALLTEEAFGDIDPERLVVVFLGANAISTACEPIILARLGLRRTVLFGSLLLMIGSIVKSGGVPPILESDIVMGHDEWRLYFGFFLVGLSQPLYQCTPALLSASWFPEKERTMATGVALNANQLGIGFAFIFGTLLVAEKEDIIPYFGLLSSISTIVFLGTLIQFDDAPPTPPSSSARVMRGSLEVNLPSIDTIVQSVRGLGTSDRPNAAKVSSNAAPSPAANHAVGQKDQSSSRMKGKARRRVLAPSSARSGPTWEVSNEIERLKSEAGDVGVNAPSPAIEGRVGTNESAQNPGEGEQSSLYADVGVDQEHPGLNQAPMGEAPTTPQGQPGPYGMPPPPPPGMMPPYGMPPPQYQYPYWDPRMQQQMQQQQMQQQAYYQQQYFYYQQAQQPQQMPPPYYYPVPYPQHLQGYDIQNAGLPAAGIDEGAEPIVTITPHHLDIDIRDDQVILSTKACLKRPGFIHALVSFTVSGIVINTLSTYMDYLVRLNGAPRYYTGVVGGTFQFIIMISSLIIGSQTDKTRAYYSVTIGMLVLGAFGLAECGVSLEADRGSDLRWSLVIVAALVGPLQPVSTELGVDVAYPLSENTVLVIQQLFSNLLSALFIPVFKALKDFGSENVDDADMLERPEYTFSFYLLIVLHTAATVFFATFNGKYLRYEHELQKKAEEERQAAEQENSNAFHPFYSDQQGGYSDSVPNERQPLVTNQVV